MLIQIILATPTATGIRRACTQAALAIFAVAIVVSSASAAGAPKRFAKLDEELNRRAVSGPSSETTSVIARFAANQLPPELKQYVRSFLPLVNGYVLDVPNAKLQTIGGHASTIFANHNGTVRAFNFRVNVQSGAFFARRLMGATGAGVGVAVLDSGITNNSEVAPTYFEDFLVPDSMHVGQEVNCGTTPCDPNGHGTHVTGTIAGNGFYSLGERAGMAPDASIIALRVLGKDGSGSLAGVINALEWVRLNAATFNIRVVNLSFGLVPSGHLPDPQPLATMLDKALGDPLAIATKALVDAGIFVVAAGGNVGQVDCGLAWLKTPASPDPLTGKCDVWGGITAPGIYPWVFTAGAASSMGSFTRRDDTRAAFSSRGPAFPLQNAKPDILAGGVGIESTSAPGSTLFNEAAKDGFLLDGGLYMALTGTSQASAACSGVAAQMLQANPRLTPNFIKAILQYTSQEYTGYTPLEQGAGFLNALGAVRLSRFYATARIGQIVPVEPIWSKHLIWGNHQMSGGLMLPDANAWNLGVMWGMPKVNGDTGDNIVWGTSCGAADCGDNIVWGTSAGDNIVWGTADGDNIVWGTSADGDNIVWGIDCGGADCDNIVWGTAGDGDNIVWGTAEPGDNIVWGTVGDGDNIVWGTANGDNIVWGTGAGDNIVWGTDAGDNIVWGTAGDNIVWGTAGDGDNIVWGTGWLGAAPVTQADWYRLFLKRPFDLWWVAREFGDRFIAKGGTRVPQSTYRVRPRATGRDRQR